MAFIHEASYRGFGLAPLVHRARLRRVVRLVSQLSLPAAGTLADLGCANGIVISQLRDKLFRDKDYRFFGFDHSGEHLVTAYLSNSKMTIDSESSSCHNFN